MTWLALDIGGAHIKSADGLGYVASTYFPLWQRPQELAAALRAVLAHAPASQRLAVTMTGELADCYRTKEEGVRGILQGVEAAAEGREIWVYLTSGGYVSASQAACEPLLAAASNWHALARFAGRYAPSGNGLVVDIGSTTSDLVPLREGRLAAAGFNDPERLASGELVYTGVERSPICAIARQLPWRDRECSTAQELFATTWDAYLLLGDLPEDPSATHTADGRPATKQHAWERLARMVCADRDLMDFEDAVRAARRVQEAQLDQLVRAASDVLRRLAQPPRTVVVSGRGEFLARRLVARIAPGANVFSLREILGEEVSRCATAHALAALAREEAIR